MKMKMKSPKLPAVLIAAAMCSAGSAAAYTGENLAPEAKITMEQALRIAQEARAGTVSDKELERENGRLRYSFDIKAGTGIYEVGVDAQTGMVVENAAEGPNPD